MFDAQRFRSRLALRGISQSELARRVGVSQASIYRLASGDAYGSKHLHRIARELGTTPAYLTGETDDPDAGAPPPAAPQPALNHVRMPVALPRENALARMFEGLLAVVDLSASPAELARELAQLLPTGLTQLRGPLTELAPGLPPRRAEVAEALASADRARRRLQRT